MTEIKIKKRTPFWVWLLAAAVIAVILYFIFQDRNTSAADALITEDIAQTGVLAKQENNETVTAYIAFVKADTIDMALDHSYTSTALNTLVAATQAMADAVGFEIEADLSGVRIYADEITKDPMATTHADKIKAAAIIMGNALQNMQRAKYPTLDKEADEVLNAAGEIDPDVLTLDQKGKVQSFFEKAANLLQRMN